MHDKDSMKQQSILNVFNQLFDFGVFRADINTGGTCILGIAFTQADNLVKRKAIATQGFFRALAFKQQK